MHRLFVALRPPPAVRAALSATMDAVPEARWQNDDQIHLTVRYIGGVDRRMAEDVVLALGQVHAAPIEVALSGVGAFDKKGRVDALWAGVTPHDALAALHRKVDHALVRLGLEPEGRAYLPHITLARISRNAGFGPEIEHWQAAYAGLASQPFTIEHMSLFESHLGGEAARYEVVERWRLAWAEFRFRIRAALLASPKLKRWRIMAITPTGASARTPAYAWYVLGILFLVYILNFVDRQIISILAEDIKRDLGLKDEDLGFLYGTAFGVFYSLFGIPLGRLADNWNRVRLMTIGLALWSAMTAFSGFARNGAMLTAARIGVGVGEATASPRPIR